jgi:hypothetical protein
MENSKVATRLKFWKDYVKNMLFSYEFCMKVHSCQS